MKCLDTKIGILIVKYEKRLLLICKHHFKSDLINCNVYNISDQMIMIMKKRFENELLHDASAFNT